MEDDKKYEIYCPECLKKNLTLNVIWRIHATLPTVSCEHCYFHFQLAPGILEAIHESKMQLPV